MKMKRQMQSKEEICISCPYIPIISLSFVLYDSLCRCMTADGMTVIFILKIALLKIIILISWPFLENIC
jgi:hypothetical protein